MISEMEDAFVLQRFGDRGDSKGDLQFETMDEAMRHVYGEYNGLSDWRSCADATSGESIARVFKGDQG